ncbi:MAG: hypothetical protein RIF37_08775 [Rhodospirillaceae bacterium]
MINKPINPYGHVCRVEIDLPWEIAELLVDQGPRLILAISDAIGDRKRDAERQENRTAKIKADCDTRKAETLKIGAEAESEITRRSNGSGQRNRIIKQLASEYGYPAYELNSIIRAYRNDQKERRLRKQHLRALTLHLQGFTHKEIGQKLDLSAMQIGNILCSSSLLDSIKKAISDVNEENSGGSK